MMKPSPREFAQLVHRHAEEMWRETYAVYKEHAWELVEGGFVGLSRADCEAAYAAELELTLARLEFSKRLHDIRESLEKHL